MVMMCEHALQNVDAVSLEMTDTRSVEAYDL